MRLEQISQVCVIITVIIQIIGLIVGIKICCESAMILSLLG